MKHAHDEPSETIAEHGEVIVEGPGAIAFSLTPQAAAETAKRMLVTAQHAATQPDCSYDADGVPRSRLS